MSQIRHIGIEGFRRLNDVDIEMRPMMVLIGANGVGKTSFMDVLSMLAASAKGALNQSLNQVGGIGSVITRNRLSDMALRAEMEVPQYEPLQYSLQVAIQGQGYSISQEMLTQSRAGYDVPFKHIDSQHGVIRYFDPAISGLARPDWEHDAVESALSQVPRMFHQPE